MHAEEWNETSSACTTCMCVNGEIRCKKPVCPAVSSKCRRLYRRPGDCCEECVVNDAPKPSPPAYPSGGGNNQTVPIVLTVSFLFIFFVLVVGLALCIVRKRYPHVIQSIQSRLRFRHKVRIHEFYCCNLLRIYKQQRDQEERAPLPVSVALVGMQCFKFLHVVGDLWFPNATKTSHCAWCFI